MDAASREKEEKCCGHGTEAYGTSANMGKTAFERW